MTEMIFGELSNAAFRFSLRRPGAEIMGGGRSNANPPPPPAGGGKTIGPAGRGLSSIIYELLGDIYGVPVREYLSID